MLAALALVCTVAGPGAPHGVASAPVQEPGDAARRAPPNVVLVVADDLGYGDLGCYGQRKLRTPRLDAMAAEGLRFTQFYAGSTVCAPSRCVLMTGMDTGRCHIRGNARVDLRPEDVTVAEVLQASGYATGAFGKWGLGQAGSTGVPTRQGFDAFYGYLDQVHAHNYWPEFLVRGEERVPLRNVVPDAGRHGQGVASERRDYSHDLIAEEALRFLEQHHARPFFLYVAFTIPHANNEAGADGMEVPDLGAFAAEDWPEPQKRLAAMIARLDRDVGRILDALVQHGIAERTLVLFTSDNGPHREGGNDPDFQDSNGPLRGIKRSLHEGGIRVPLLARWPGTIAGGVVSDHVAGFVDVLPTLAELCRAEVPDVAHGQSFRPVLFGDAGGEAPSRHLYWEFYEQGSRQAVREGRWKAIREPMRTGRLRLYDLATDPGEERDVAGEHADVVRRLEALLDECHRPDPLWKASGRAPARR